MADRHQIHLLEDPTKNPAATDHPGWIEPLDRPRGDMRFCSFTQSFLSIFSKQQDVSPQIGRKSMEVLWQDMSCSWGIDMGINEKASSFSSKFGFLQVVEGMEHGSIS
jgi:hypothetical protein